MILWASSPIEDIGHHASAGQIVGIDGEAMIVQTGSGVIRIEEWTMDDGQPPRLHSVLGYAQ